MKRNDMDGENKLKSAIVVFEKLGKLPE